MQGTVGVLLLFYAADCEELKAGDEKKAAYKEEKAVYEAYQEKRDATIRENPSLDVALLGRMLANNKKLSCTCAMRFLWWDWRESWSS